MFGLDPGMTIVLISCILAACIFEFINGFHDTANAVATVIYTNSLKPSFAVAWSGVFNFIGVFLGGIGVAMGIIKLLPYATLEQGSAQSIILILSIIISAIIWNLGTWYFGIPCSSSHTLLGSIFGAALAFTLIPGNEAVGLNWMKIKDAGLSLMLSPLVGFGLTMGLVSLVKWLSKKYKYKKLFEEPNKKKAPPLFIRSILILTCTGVSLSHGSNDGQKGVGLIMIILFALVPYQFSINHALKPEDLRAKINQTENVIFSLNTNDLGLVEKAKITEINIKIDSMQAILAGVTSFKDINKERHIELKQYIAKTTDQLTTIVKHKNGDIYIPIDDNNKTILKSAVSDMKKYIEFAPFWVILIISLSLGIGTMVGWKRIVITIGEKIGKEHLTYAQGASAELVAASTIFISTVLKLPVSTTHVLSSGVAGSMVATNGLKNLRMKTVKNILIAWLITLPVTVLLSGGIYLLLHLFI